MGQEARVLVRDQPRRLPDAEPGGLAPDHPRAQHHPVAREVGQGRQLLVAAGFVAEHLGAARLVDGDAGALTAEQRLGDVPRPVGSGHVTGAVEIGGEEVGVSRIQLPEDGQQRLVGEEHLPGGLDPAGASGASAVVQGVQHTRSEAVRGQPFPRVQLEAAADEAEPLVDEAAGELVPADPLDGQRLGVDPGLRGGLPEVRHRHQVLAELVAVGVGEVQGARRQQRGLPLPRVDETFVQGVPLVGAGEAVLHPEPLGARGLHQGGGGVRVVLQHPGRTGPVVPEVEPAVQGGEFGTASPGLGDQAREPRVGDPEVGEAVVLDDVRGCGQAHGVELLHDLFQCLDLGQREDVVGALVPVGAQGSVRVTGQGVDQPLLLDGFLPSGARLRGAAFHGSRQPPLEPEEPKPPRSTADLSKLPPDTRFLWLLPP